MFVVIREVLEESACCTLYVFIMLTCLCLCLFKLLLTSTCITFYIVHNFLISELGL